MLRCGLPLFLLLAGCSQAPAPPVTAPATAAGTWLNQALLEQAREQARPRQAALEQGPEWQWQINPRLDSATLYTDGTPLTLDLHRQPDGSLLAEGQGNRYLLRLSGGNLLQIDAQHNERLFIPAQPGMTLGGQLLHDLLGSEWQIHSGTGQGQSVRFQTNGQVDGLPGIARAELCLGGACSLGIDGESLWTSTRTGTQLPLYFDLQGHWLALYQPLPISSNIQSPIYQPGWQRWLLRRQQP